MLKLQSSGHFILKISIDAWIDRNIKYCKCPALHNKIQSVYTNIIILCLSNPVQSSNVL